MASPDPAVVERQYWLDKLGLVDDPDLSLSDLKAMTGGGARVDLAANLSAQKVLDAVGDNKVAALITPGSGSTTEETLNAAYGSMPRLGVVAPLNLVDSELQDAANSAATFGLCLVAAGTITTSSTLVITSAADLSQLTINYTGNGIAVQIGAGTLGTLLMRKKISLGPIINTSKVVAGWLGDTTGIKAINTFGCIITVARVRNFVTGYYMYGFGGGNVYNTVHLLHLDNNKRNLVIGAGSGGWANSNSYYFGSLQHDSSEGNNVIDVRQILIETTANIINGNLFEGGSVEGNTAEYHLDCDGMYNSFEEIRWENAGGCRVIWRGNAVRNIIKYGYQAQSIVETHMAGSYNRIFTTGTSRIIGSTTKALQCFENTNSSASGIDAIMDPGATVNGADIATAYRLYRSADATKMKRAIDTTDRLILDHVNGRIYFSNGTDVPVSYLQYDSLGLVKLNSASFYPSTHNTNDLGINSIRWRHIRAGTTVITGANTTANRPAAATGVGAMFYDTTLSKPIWSDGVNWRDAAGTIV